MSLLTKKSVEVNNELVKLIYDSFDNNILMLENDAIRQNLLGTIDKIINKFNSSNFIQLENKNFILESKSGRTVKIDGNYIKFDMKLYNSYCFWFDDTVFNDQINDVQMMFHKFVGLFGKLIIRKQYLHKDGYLVFDCYNIEIMKDEIYTVSGDKDKKFGYFYINS